MRAKPSEYDPVDKLILYLEPNEKLVAIDIDKDRDYMIFRADAGGGWHSDITVTDIYRNICISKDIGEEEKQQ